MIFPATSTASGILLISLALRASATKNITVDSETLKTWWHNTGEINTNTAVQDGNVRQSHLYFVQVAESSACNTYYDSFVYESIPRNGNGKICAPRNTTICDTDDQITIEADIGVSMSWTQYLTSTDTVVKVTRSDGGSVSASNVVIRPTNLDFELFDLGKALLIKVPYSSRGYRFSVEFQDNIWEYRNAGPGLGSHYVQNKDPSGTNFVPRYNNSMPVVGREPLNALLVFVSPSPSSGMVPCKGPDTYMVKPGLVTGLDFISQSIAYFAPGVYWFTGTALCNLSSTVDWVYIAPGAYVKGAIEFQSQASTIRATGFGVVSGEQYVYQANTAEGFTNVKSDDSSLRMWSGHLANNAHFILNGLTTNAPPFNSMDMYADDVTTLLVTASDYKQVGAFFGQTDGMEMYPGSHIFDVFYHVGDDGIKTYYSNVLAERVTVWKTLNAPIVQFGWYSRNISNITVNDVNVIHTRYIDNTLQYPRGLLGSSCNYLNTSSTSTANVSNYLSNYTISNWRCEGLCPALIGVNPLENIDNMVLENIWVESLANDTTQVDRSRFSVYTDSAGTPVVLGSRSKDNYGLVIKGFYVGDERITWSAENWDINSLGRLNIDQYWWGRWHLE